ncbi:MAG: transpeptidase family protein [FCB group bacterium]|nr:transpeptidase family protein [FCB group bacterium]
MNKIYSQYRGRIRWISLGVLIAWTGLIVRLFSIQIAHGAEYRALGLRQSQKRQIIRADRGTIFDRKGIPLTGSVSQYALAADPTQIAKPDLVAGKIAKILNKNRSEISKKLSLRKRFVYLDRNLSPTAYRQLAQDKPYGIILEKTTQRVYPHSHVASQILGFTDIDNHGVTGLEQRLNTLLEGKSGWEVLERNGWGELRTTADTPMKPAQPGANITLTIDVDYQSILQEELDRRVNETGAKSGMGLILNPQTGFILAMASVPDYDPNQAFSFGIENQKLRPVTDQFEPGSTFKIVTLIAALDQQTVQLNTEFNCEYGAYKVDNIRITDHEEYGLLTVPQIIENSSNVGTIKIAETLGPQRLYRYARDLGFGAQTQIDLPGEGKGVLRKVRDWSKVSLAEVSIGQEVAVTLLQLGMAYAAIANGGYLLRPVLIREIKTPDGEVIQENGVTVIRKIASEDVMRNVRAILRRVVETGTGMEASIDGWSVAGKTGTAQKYVEGGYSQSKFVSDFAGFLPADNPQLLTIIAIDEPRYGMHWGGVSAAVAFRRIMERIISMDDSILPPSREAEPREDPDQIQWAAASAVATTPQSRSVLLSSVTFNDDVTIVPDVRGMSLKKAMITLQTSGLTCKLNGSGVVTWQSPKPGKQVPLQTLCQLGLN